ncbi:outer membrane beta-barrel protein [Lewinella sp. IMCC34183]|uniref:outer membrane beta-barrel protein n=1 Tax=Lewinella sp. IMCC34183 TaxID=2248762 RepID=UPI000E25B4B2|nr:outer membrane beta-barrel protein [Lewinella sp. IMCC34183]
MNVFRTAVFCLTLLPVSLLHAQEFSGGFRAGLNFISFDADSEMGADGMDLEEFNRTTGFHVGATFAYAITDLFGLKADLMYSQKGGEVLYNGPSYFYLYSLDPSVNNDRLTGTVTSERDVLNSYIDIPLVAYHKIGPVELEAGVSAGFLVNSRASGSAEYTNLINNQGQGIEPISVNYDFNYFNNVTQQQAVIESDPNNTFPTVIDAYYNSEDDRPLYRRLDFGLVGGASFFLNSGLYLGVRYQFGLTDATRGENDLRLTRTDGVSEREYNVSDKDYNRVIQASVGFRF